MKKELKLNLGKIIALIIIVELILGGSGHLIEFFGLSLRTLTLGAGIFYVIIKAATKSIQLHTQDILLGIILLYFTFNLLISTLLNNIPSAINGYMGYLPLILCLFFENTFENIKLYEIDKLVRLIENLILVVAIISICTWAVAALDISNYYQIQNIFNKYNYGTISYVGLMPRVFLKGSIYVCIGLLLSYRRIKQNRKRKFEYIRLFIYMFSSLVTFTMGLYIAIAIAFIFIATKERKKLLNIKKNFLPLIIVVIGLIAIVVRLDLGSVLYDRLYATNYSSISFRVEMMIEGMKAWLTSPIFGRGFGYILEYGTLSRSQLEIMWLELLINTGIIGLTLYLMHIIGTLGILWRKYKKTNNSIYLYLFAAIIILCVESATNPIMNNALGIVFYAICCGIARMDDTKNPSKKLGIRRQDCFTKSHYMKERSRKEIINGIC